MGITVIPRIAYRIIIILTLIMFGVSCTSSDYSSVSDISRSWLNIKMYYSTASFNEAESEARFENLIDNFIETLDSFFSSPVAHLYRINISGELYIQENIINAISKLKAGILSGETHIIYSAMLEIDSAIFQIQSIDTDFSDMGQLRYFQLFFFFAMLIIIIIMVLFILSIRLIKSETRMKETLALSKETIIILEQERERIARELHDTVAQDLWHLSFHIDSIGKTPDPETRSRLCTEAVTEQKVIMQKIRDICNSLIPPDFKNRGLENALQSLCHDFLQHTKIECHLVIQKGLELKSLDIDTQLQIFRIVQECLINIRKHSGADEVSVLVHTRDKETLVISISDNGRGFTAPGRDSFASLREEGKFGLWSMYERIGFIGGKMDFDCSVGEGAIITLQLPFTEEPA